MRPIAELVNDTLSNLRQLPIKIMRSGAPPNWHALTDDELETLLDIAEAGIPVTWVPRTDILRELAAARPDGRIAVLTKHETEIVDDCAAVVTEISAGEFAYFAAYLDEAIAVQRAGHPAAAQAIAASALDTLLRVAVHPPEKTGYYRKIKEKISEQVKWIPGAVAHLPILTALDTFFGEKDPIPTAFNRHATIHAVSPDQYTNGNALVSLMLAASILREAHHVQPDVGGQHNDEPDEDQLTCQADTPRWGSGLHRRVRFLTNSITATGTVCAAVVRPDATYARDADGSLTADRSVGPSLPSPICPVGAKQLARRDQVFVEMAMWA